MTAVVASAGYLHDDAIEFAGCVLGGLDELSLAIVFRRSWTGRLAWFGGLAGRWGQAESPPLVRHVLPNPDDGRMHGVLGPDMGRRFRLMLGVVRFQVRR